MPRLQRGEERTRLNDALAAQFDPLQTFNSE